MIGAVIVVLAAMVLWGLGGAAVSKAVERSADKPGRKPKEGRS